MHTDTDESTPPFMWAVGIEDTFIPQLAKRTGRVLDEYDLTQHYRFWREDLALAASLGVRTMRYGIPWYRVNPEPGVFDWSWTDQVLDHMVSSLGIQPIIDFVHYGCPLWMEREFANPEYPERVAEYARAFVERYRGLTRYYTPLNEPLINTLFSGHAGYWPPYERGPRGYVKILMAIARGMSLTVAGIRGLQPDAVIVQAEATSSIIAEDPSLSEELEDAWRRQFLPNDLLLGRVDGDHPLRPWLVENGAPPQVLDWLCEHPQDIDFVGANFYPGMNCWKLVRQDGDVRSKRYYGGVSELETVLRAYHGRYRKPVMITETSTIGTVRRREKWMSDSLGVVRRVRSEGVPIVGYTLWPLFSLVKWEYRPGRKPVAAYLAHMGLWDLRQDGDGVLLRERTPLVDQYAGYVANTRAAVGDLEPTPVA